MRNLRPTNITVRLLLLAGFAGLRLSLSIRSVKVLPAFPGFLILNTKKIQGLSTQVKLYVYNHECGHQFVGASETKADLFAIRRGVKERWLDAQGIEDICTFISRMKGDSAHPPGSQRCETMRSYYRQLVGADNYSGFIRW